MKIIQTNRQYKDRLFRLIFGDNKEQLLNLYNALSDTNYTDVNDLEINTLDDVIYIHMKNDVSFIISSNLVLFEQQSTYNPNMPLREFMYCGQLFSKWITVNKKNVYGKSLVKIPTPICYVFYNGTDIHEDVKVLRLSDAFANPPEKNIPLCEWSVTMININKGYNSVLLEKCNWLKNYSDFVAMIRDLSLEMEIDSAINQTVNYFIEKGDDFSRLILKHKSEVFDMCLTEFNEEVFVNSVKEEGRQEGLAEGRRQQLVAMIKNLMLSQNCTAKRAMDMLLIPEEEQTLYQDLLNK